jgi:divalent metal cation (Fe/Co/Zn/Cd) transporter
VSVVWTAVTSSIAIGVGISASSVVLTAFGAVGGFDMAGSVALVVHFRHALRHEAISEGHERIAQLVVSLGLLTVGVATVVASAIRFAHDRHTAEPVAGLITTGASIVVLAYLGVRKRALGARIPSQALVTDGWLSLTCCGTATCAVVGLALNEGFGWTRADPAAAIVVATIAIGLAVVSLRPAATPGGRPPRHGR